MSKFRVLTPDEALTLIAFSKEHRQGKRPLPPEIAKKKKEIEAKTRNAELFMAIFRVVDYGMVDEIVELKLQLDTLYGAWTTSETRPIHRSSRSLH